MYQYFIPFYGKIIFNYMTKWIYYMFFMNFSVDGHLSYFHLGVFINNAAMNIHIWDFMWSCFQLFWHTHMLSRIRVIWVTLFLSFWGTIKLFSKVGVSFYIPHNNEWELQFLHILINTYFLTILKPVGELWRCIHCGCIHIAFP